MTTKQYTCTLLSDVVLNSSLATEGNMTSLDYIPGSNFLGMVAGNIYNSPQAEKAYDLLHSGKVKFGDATISKDGSPTFTVPFSFFMDKLDKEIGKDPIYLHHLIEKDNRPKKSDGETTAQLKQMRGGYILSDKQIVKEIDKNHSLKSAQNRETRASKDGAMFGFEAIEKGQIFVFSIDFEKEVDVEIIEKELIGIKRLGKSKNAEFGQVEIKKIENITIEESFESEDYLLVYAQSNLYFTDNFGQATLQPKVTDLGFTSGEINWDKSQVRSFSYSPWNSTRNTSSMQRHCIAKGSVFYVEATDKLENSSNFVGGFQAEGLGKVLYNPFFLKPGEEKPEVRTDLSKYDSKKDKNQVHETAPANSILAMFLAKKQAEQVKELNISKKVIIEIELLKNGDKKDVDSLIKITSSQWGGIRAYASKTRDISQLNKDLFGYKKVDCDTKVDGYLTHGVADEKHWGKHGNLNKFNDIFKKNENLGTVFIAKFAAEMAKENKRYEKNNKHGK
jgi:hypothetical protein